MHSRSGAVAASVVVSLLHRAHGAAAQTVPPPDPATDSSSSSSSSSTAPPTTPTDAPVSSGGLSQEGLIGLIVGCVVSVLIIGLVTFACIRKKKLDAKNRGRQPRIAPERSTTHVEALARAYVNADHERHEWAAVRGAVRNWQRRERTRCARVGRSFRHAGWAPPAHTHSLMRSLSPNPLRVHRSVRSTTVSWARHAVSREGQGDGVPSEMEGAYRVVRGNGRWRQRWCGEGRRRAGADESEQ